MPHSNGRKSGLLDCLYQKKTISESIQFAVMNNWDRLSGDCGEEITRDTRYLELDFQMNGGTIKTYQIAFCSVCKSRVFEILPKKRTDRVVE